MGLPNIGIIGKMGAGKTTVAKYLEDKYGYQRTSLAEPMRQIVKGFRRFLPNLKKLGSPRLNLDEWD